MNKLIVMDDVSAHSAQSTHFSNFLTISRKYGFTCIYVFRTIYPNRQNWEMIMSQTHILNFFPGSIHNSKILKTLSLFANQQKTLIYLRDRFGLINFIMKYLIVKKKKCLTVDTRDINEFGPGKFRTSAGEQQTCYFYKNNSDSYFKSFISQRTQAERTTFSIFKAKSDINFPDKNLDIFKYQMENLKENFNNLVKKTSEMDPVETMEYMTTLQSQPMYESENEAESQQDQIEKKPKFLEKWYCQ